MTALAQRPTLSRPLPWDFPTVAEQRTSDGLRVLACHLPDQQRIAVRVLVDAPVTADPAELAGLASITANTLDEGSDLHDAAAFADAVDRIGASFGAGASIGGSWVGVTVARWRLGDALPLLAEAIARPTFPEEEVKRLVRQTRDGIVRELATPDGRASRALRASAIDASHRTHLPASGDLDTVERITRDAVIDFHTRQYVRGSATIVVAGDLDGLDVGGALDRALVGWTGAGPERAPGSPVVAAPGPRSQVIHVPGAVQTQVALGRVGPDRHAGDWPAARVAAYVLGGTLTSRIDSVLREERGYTYGMRTSLRSLRRGGLATLAAGSVQTDVTGPALEALSEIVAELAEEGPTAEEVRVAVDALVGVEPLRVETVGAIANRIVGDIGEDLPADHTGTELAQMRALSVEEVRAACLHVAAADAHLIAVGDAEVIEPVVAGLPYGPVEVIREPATD